MDSAKLFRENLNRHFSRVGKALSSHKRLEILELLNQSSKNVDQLANLTGMSAANTSQHLQVLRGAGLVESSREGTHINYRLSGVLVWELVRKLRQVAETHLADVDRAVAQLRENQHILQEVDRQELAQLVTARKVIILDVRPADEYKTAHIQQAISIPLDQLEDHLDQLPVDQQIVAYCRGPYCLLASQAVAMLRSRGYKANELGEGLAEWHERGGRIETE
ncbi:metalloregulator ArsR/SmtB family transcription factor [bacterium]|nr:metalloregulator ArsR/SmtB family transcription factor [bacterium]